MFSFTPAGVSLNSGEGRLKFTFTVPVVLLECLSRAKALIYREQCTILP